jgi:hypothetical protein
MPVAARTARLAFLLWLGSLGTSQAADDAARIVNIEKAATEIGAIQKAKGADGAFATIQECYRKELAAARTLTRELERCMAQDIIVSQMSASFYAKISQAARQKAGVPEPDAVTNEMVQRVVGVFRRFKIAEQDSREFARLVNERGTSAYGRTMFPDQSPAMKK